MVCICAMAFLLPFRSTRLEERKKMRKRLIAATAAAALLLSLTACSQPDEQPEPSAGQDTQALVSAYLEQVDQEYAYQIAETLAYDPAYLSNELGWRTAGSDAEHAAADYIAAEMESIGLTVEKVPVTVDKWQFNDASLTIADTDIQIMPASYATNGTDADGITAQLVDVGTGTAAEYEGVDVEGKIALVGVTSGMWPGSTSI